MKIIIDLDVIEENIESPDMGQLFDEWMNYNIEVIPSEDEINGSRKLRGQAMNAAIRTVLTVMSLTKSINILFNLHEDVCEELSTLKMLHSIQVLLGGDSYKDKLNDREVSTNLKLRDILTSISESLGLDLEMPFIVRDIDGNDVVDSNSATEAELAKLRNELGHENVDKLFETTVPDQFRNFLDDLDNKTSDTEDEGGE